MRKQREQLNQSRLEDEARSKEVADQIADTVAHLEDGDARPGTSEMRALLPRPDTAPVETLEMQVAKISNS